MSDNNLKVGDTYSGKVNGTAPFGVFVDLPGKKRGLLHVSKLIENTAEQIAQKYKVGDEIQVKIIDQKADRISLDIV